MTMSAGNPTALGQKLWNYCNTPRDDGLSLSELVFIGSPVRRIRCVALSPFRRDCATPEGPPCLVDELLPQGFLSSISRGKGSERRTARASAPRTGKTCYAAEAISVAVRGKAAESDNPTPPAVPSAPACSRT